MTQHPRCCPTEDPSDWLSSENNDEEEAEEWATEDHSGEEETWDVESPLESETLPDFEEETEGEGEHLFDDEDCAPAMVVGHREHVSLPQLGLHQVLARFSSDSSMSLLHAEIHQSRGDHVTFKLDQLELELPAFEHANDLCVALQLELAGIVLEGVFKVVSTSGQPYLVVGRDLMAGHLLIDPSGEWLKSRR